MMLYYLYTDSLKCSLPGNTDGIAYAPAPFWGQGWRKGGGIIKEEISPEHFFLVFAPAAALATGTKKERACQTGDFRYR
jgi:hypothetical protein